MDMVIYWDGPTILDNGRVQVIVVGYNHKMRLLLDTIIGKIMHFEVKADRFDVIKSKEAESIVNHIEDVLFHGLQPMCKPLFPSQHLTNRIVKLERGMGYFYPVACLNVSDENSSLVHYIQLTFCKVQYSGSLTYMADSEVALVCP
ncbi:Zinc-metallopeptidase, peroxisomal [Acorus calamus]|uniref:Zinc-metallopeptidase, peroxisomal n=1 Tax=Acorus calamus TaxID=4465 RepID=A0AAV9F7G6_ACOCL|nr:Zinc-metallopeptidase, peroxisomal [Acorus calamus]